jgi:hypothetical protein
MSSNETDPGTPPSDEAPAKSKRSKESVWEVYWPKNIDGHREALNVASFPPIVYFWPTMVMLLAGGLLQSLGLASEITIGWLVSATLTFNLLVTVVDLDQKKFVISLLVLALVCTGLWVAHDKQWAILGAFTVWLGGLEPTYNTDTLFLLLAAISSLFVIGMMRPRLNYWRFEPNEFTHYVQPFGREQSIPRAGSTVTREVPDMLELILLLGGGSLVVRREGQVVARIEHVPFLGRRMPALEAMLGVTRVQHVD